MGRKTVLRATSPSLYNLKQHCVASRIFYLLHPTFRMSDRSYYEAPEADTMSTASPATKDLARRLLAFEAEHNNASEARVHVAAQVIDQLRTHLIRLAGVVGFRSLLSRALTLAKSEVPLLNMVHVGADGSLKGLEGIAQSQEAGADERAALVLVAHLLDRLVTFIGQPLTLRLVIDAWPDASIDGANLRTEEKP